MMIFSADKGQAVKGLVRVDAPARRDKLVWGWLRLLLGFAQMSLAAAGIGSLLAVGAHPVTLFFLVGATVLTIVSRVLYRGERSKGE